MLLCGRWSRHSSRKRREVAKNYNLLTASGIAEGNTAMEAAGHAALVKIV
jgi:hypothetical protein